MSERQLGEIALFATVLSVLIWSVGIYFYDAATGAIFALVMWLSFPSLVVNCDKILKGED